MRSPASGSLATTDPATTPEARTRTVQSSVTDGDDSEAADSNVDSKRRIHEEPMTVKSRGRLYTTGDIRRRLGCDDDQAGRGTRVVVKIDNVDRREEWIHVETAVFPVTLATDGVIRIPADTRDELDLSTGDSVRVSIRTKE